MSALMTGLRARRRAERVSAERDGTWSVLLGSGFLSYPTLPLRAGPFVMPEDALRILRREYVEKPGTRD
jgi:hypothetical protein